VGCWFVWPQGSYRVWAEGGAEVQRVYAAVRMHRAVCVLRGGEGGGAGGAGAGGGGKRGGFEAPAGHHKAARLEPLHHAAARSGSRTHPGALRRKSPLEPPWCPLCEAEVSECKRGSGNSVS
jgi:hypothetical protein